MSRAQLLNMIIAWLCQICLILPLQECEFLISHGFGVWRSHKLAWYRNRILNSHLKLVEGSWSDKDTIWLNATLIDLFYFIYVQFQWFSPTNMSFNILFFFITQLLDVQSSDYGYLSMAFFVFFFYQKPVFMSYNWNCEAKIIRKDNVVQLSNNCMMKIEFECYSLDLYSTVKILFFP